jgi:hypothetical protein
MFQIFLFNIEFLGFRNKFRLSFRIDFKLKKKFVKYLFMDQNSKCSIVKKPVNCRRYSIHTNILNGNEHTRSRPNSHEEVDGDFRPIKKWYVFG